MLPELGTKEFTEYLNKIGHQSNPKRHKFYKQTVEHMKAMGVHMTGDSPKKLLDIKRPNEPDEAKKYRLKSYKPKTKASASKVTSVINRIYNERLYSIEYPESPSGLITKDNGLKEYLTVDMPYYVSLINYMKSVFTKMHLKDPNGVIGVLPSFFEVEDTDLFEPVPIFYTSEEVVDFIDEEYFTILLNQDKTQKIILFTKDDVFVFVREKLGDNFALKLEYNHGFDKVQAFRVGGIVIDTERPQLFESFIAGVLPHWDDAVGMYSDLQAVIVNHIYPEKWEFTIDCDEKGCVNGTINVEAAAGGKTTRECSTCHGTGKKTSKSPFSIYQVNRDALNVDAALPTPPFGYGEKELGSTELLEKLVEKEIIKGYEAINMDIIAKVGENQSGVAKTIDRQDLDGFLDVYSSHIFNYVLPNIIQNIILWRYGQVLSEEQMKDYFPTIKEPTTFDVYSITLLTDEFARLKEAGVGGSFLTGIQEDIIEKRFPDERTKAFYKTVLHIDPLAQLTNEEMMTNSRVIGRLEMYIHTYAKDLVEEAIEANDAFLALTLAERKAVIRALAESKLEPEVILPENV